MANYIARQGLVYHYECEGQGEPIVLIHGFAGSGRWWQLQREFFKGDYKVLTIDLPGHGQSTYQPVTLTEMATHIRHIIMANHMTNANVVASSFGGLIAFELYRIDPTLVMRMSLVGSIPKFARSANYPAGLDIVKIRTMAKQFDGDYTAILDIFFRSLFTMQERNGSRWQWLKELRQSEPVPKREALLAFLEMLEKVDLRDRLSSIVCPLQFITGAEDYLCPKDVMQWVQDHCLNARLDTINHCGHLPFLTEPEQYNDLVENFLIN